MNLMWADELVPPDKGKFGGEGVPLFSQRQHGLCQVGWVLKASMTGFALTAVGQRLPVSPRPAWLLYPGRWSPRVVHLGLLMRMNKLCLQSAGSSGEGILAQSPS